MTLQNTRFVFILLLAVTFGFGCAHKRTVKLAPNFEQSAIQAELDMQCEGPCPIRQCWEHTSTVTICDVEFTMVPRDEQRIILRSASEGLKFQGFKVGFCGRESVDAGFVGAVVEVLFSGVIAVASGRDSNYIHLSSSSYESSVTPSHSSKMVEDACYASAVASR